MTVLMITTINIGEYKKNLKMKNNIYIKMNIELHYIFV